MRAELRSWWQKIKQHPYVVAGIIVAIFALIALIAFTFAVSKFGWDWTGFGQYTSPPHPQNTDFERTKTLWDWLQLLIVPALLSIGAIWLTTRQNHDREIASANQSEAALEAYIDNILELLFEKKLRESKIGDEVRTIARVRTLTVLPRLNAKRKRSVLLFLHDSQLIDKDKTIIGLQGADLSGAYLYGTYQPSANLCKAQLDKANLSYANLKGANLSGADLSGADLSGADLKDATGINIEELEKQVKSLKGAIMPDGKMYHNSNGANLVGVNLKKVNLSGVDLRGADLRGADLYGADLRGADLKDAKNITTEELEKQTKSLKGATMPDGSKHA